MKAPEGRGGVRPVSGSLVHSTDLGRAPEEMVVVRGQEGMEGGSVAHRAATNISAKAMPLHKKLSK